MTACVSAVDAQEGAPGGGEASPTTPVVDYVASNVESGTIELSGGVLTLTDVRMTASSGPGISVQSGTVIIMLVGHSTITGGTVGSCGQAAIYVAPGAEVIISTETDGGLTVHGGAGRVAGGAGIGGNGSDGSDPAFGTVEIAGGTITAYGGNGSNSGAAGIGAGGYNVRNTEMAFSGSIMITGGTVQAYGGIDTQSGYVGGAGIGSGGKSNSPISGSNVMSITMSDGEVYAIGGYDESKSQGCDAAGIGGGSNTSGGTIAIFGGTVRAHGTSDDGYYGGAGIGGGDNYGADLTISGGTVTASTDSSSASGIGAGQGGGGTVAISGGTVTFGDSSAGYDIRAESISITGGSVKAESFRTSVPMAGGVELHRVDITFAGLGEGAAVDSIGVDGYGMTDVLTDPDGTIYVWLPAGTVLETATADGSTYGPSEPYTVADGENDVTFSRIVPHTITVIVNGDGTATASAVSAVAGTRIELDVVPDVGNHVGSVTSEQVTVDDSHSFTMPSCDVVITVQFERNVYTVLWYAGDDVHETQSYEHGETILPPEDEPTMDGYSFVRWDGYEEGTAATSDMEYHAVFEATPQEPEGPENPYPPWLPDDDDVWIPPTIVYQEDEGGEDPWIFVVLGSVALLLFLLFFRYERRE